MQQRQQTRLPAIRLRHPRCREARSRVGPLDKIDDPFKKVIVVGRPVERHYGKTGVLMLGPYDFLLDPASLKL